MATISGMLRDEFGLVVRRRPSRRDARRRSIERFRRELKPIPGIAEALRCASAASAASPRPSQLERIRLSLEVTGLRDLLEPHIFSASMVARGKPAPDLFLQWRARWAWRPQTAPSSRTARPASPRRRQAGMRVFAFAGGSHAERAGLLRGLRDDAARPGLRRHAQSARPACRPRARATTSSAKAASAPSMSAPAARAPASSTQRGNLLGRAEHPIVMNQPKPGPCRARFRGHLARRLRAPCAARSPMPAPRRQTSPASPSTRPARWSCATAPARSSASRPAAASAGTPSSGSTTARSTRPTTARRPATPCSTISAASCRRKWQTPKLMWLKRNLPETWARAGQFFDLADFLTWRASGSNRALAMHARPANGPISRMKSPAGGSDFFAAVGIADLLSSAATCRSGPASVGADLGPLTAEAAAALGLTTDCRVGAGLIDAYAGALGALAGFAGDRATIDRHLALIAGTSSCVMAMSPEPRPFAGVWGPYFGVALPGPVAVRRRPVGDRRAARPHHPLARRRRRAGRRHASAGSPRASCELRARRRPRPCRRACTCCRIFTATARRWPIRMRSASSAG